MFEYTLLHNMVKVFRFQYKIHFFSSSLPDQYNVDITGVVTFVGRMERTRRSKTNMWLFNLSFSDNYSKDTFDCMEYV